MGLPTLEIKSAVTGEPVETLIRQALDRRNGRVAKAAKDLGISRQALYLRLEQFPELLKHAGRTRRAAPRPGAE